jgi:hypothetical protein
MTSPKYEKKKITLLMVKFNRYGVTPFLLLLLLAFCSGCGSNENPVAVDEQLYNPLRVGDYRIYKIKETQISAFDVKKNFEYEIKTVISDSIANAAGTFTYVISRFKRTLPTEAWASLDTWTSRMDSREVIVQEGNVPFLKLNFPVETGREWNGNKYNNQESVEFCDGTAITSCDLYSFGEIEKPYTTGAGVTFDKTIEVVENNNLDLIVKQDVRRAVYAWQVGLVFREINVLEYCTVGDCFGKQKVQKGLVYQQELLAYGRE